MCRFFVIRCKLRKNMNKGVRGKLSELNNPTLWELEESWELELL